ncbi:hypothetical protein GUJ93_ZPchr0164g26833 [Zizania palustris]|uniref:Uncharacterized protein n=1 Tax=Zizania palustris TaxID=103762 RepID=A0A8J6C6J1_ZIZPA|nr:hypothetical protein GUJ93_ZPchr0164g26833 [Zizania palustris]
MEKEKKLEGERVEATRRRVIGMGFWVQGFRLFPWLGVNFFLKDGMGVAASSLQILQASANLPMVAKPLVGLISDSVPICGYRRLPYVAVGALLQAISCRGWQASDLILRVSSALPWLYLRAPSNSRRQILIYQQSPASGIYRNFGIPDSIYTIVFSGLLEGLMLFKVLPFSVLVAKLCPGGCEGSVMAFVMSALALATIISGYLGVALAEFMGASGGDFSALPACLLIEAACTMLPLCFSSLIKERGEKVKKEE